MLHLLSAQFLVLHLVISEEQLASIEPEQGVGHLEVPPDSNCFKVNSGSDSPMDKREMDTEHKW